MAEASEDLDAPEIVPADDYGGLVFISQQDQAGVRSQAMRGYWRQKRRMQQPERPCKPRILLPHISDSSVFKSAESHATMDTDEKPNPMSQMQSWSQLQPEHPDPLIYMPLQRDIPPRIGIPGSHSPEPCTNPLSHVQEANKKANSKETMTNYTGLSSHATMMFEELSMDSFAPMRDVWFPLDLSNGVSFNVIMEHAAAHLARLHGIDRAQDVLQFKAEALRIVQPWMENQPRILSDQVMAAVVWFLTFEFSWGTETEWLVYRAGLQRMIEARGGISALQTNWHLQLVVYMRVPYFWFLLALV